jgi:hypothetical protein
MMMRRRRRWIGNSAIDLGGSIGYTMYEMEICGRRILFVLIFGPMGLFQPALDDADMIVHIPLSASGGLFFLAIKNRRAPISVMSSKPI